MTKISREDVFRIADQLIRRGEYPSSCRTLAFHRKAGGCGGGYQTVVRYLKRWHAQSSEGHGKRSALRQKHGPSGSTTNDAGPSWPDLPLSLNTQFISTQDYLLRVEAISKEINAIPNAATLFRRLRYAGHWLARKQRQELSLDLHLPLEPAIGSSGLWGRQDLIHATIVACRNNAMRLPTSKKLIQLYGHTFRLAANAQFKGHVPIARVAKELEPYIVIRPSIRGIDGTELQSEQERLVYDGIYRLLTKPKGRLRTGVEMEEGAYCPDIVIDGWLILEVMMFDWDVPIPKSDESRKRLIESYLERNRKKRDAYAALNRKAIFLEPSCIANSDLLAGAIRRIVELAGRGRRAEVEGLRLAKNVHASRRCQSLQDIKQLLDPLYRECGFFPTTSVMRKTGLVAVEVAIRKIHGGRDTVASLFGWPTKHRQYMPRGYFNDFENIRKAIMAVVPSGTKDMPRQPVLMQRYSAGLVAAIHRVHGGMGGVARKLGLTVSEGTLAQKKAAPYGTWNDYAEVAKATLSLVPPGCNRMPYKSDFSKAGIRGAYRAIVSKHGGLEKVASNLGLELDPKAAAIRKAVENWHASRRNKR